MLTQGALAVLLAAALAWTAPGADRRGPRDIAGERRNLAARTKVAGDKPTKADDRPPPSSGVTATSAAESPAGQPPSSAGSRAVESAPPARPTKVAVLELSALGTTDIAKSLEQYLRNSLATIGGFLVLSAIDVQMVLQDPRNRAAARCGGGVECAVKTGKLLGADVVIIGSITGFGSAFSLNLRALEVARGKERARYQATVSGRDRLIPEVRLAAYRLVAPERIRGWLVVDVDIEGVEIEIDGKAIGVTPLAGPVEDLTPGTHVVRIKRPGYVAREQQFTIRPFEPTQLRIALE